MSQGYDKKYPYHRYTLERTRASNLQFERNARPGMLKLDVDWAENYTLVDARTIQSEYWMQQQVSLFICISKLMRSTKWIATTGVLKIGAEVTVELPEKEPFWACVKSGGGGTEDSVYVVEDEGEHRHTVLRGCLRARV